MRSFLICITGFLVCYLVAGEQHDLTDDTASLDENLEEDVLVRKKRQVRSSPTPESAPATLFTKNLKIKIDSMQYRHQRYCDGDMAELFCPLHKVIVMKEGWYGGLSCTFPGRYFDVATATCGERVTENLTDMCAFRNTCSFLVNPSIIGGGLAGCTEDDDRDIFVQYDCGDVVIAPQGQKGDRGLPGVKGERGATVKPPTMK